MTFYKLNHASTSSNLEIYLRSRVNMASYSRFHELAAFLRGGGFKSKGGRSLAERKATGITAESKRGT